MEAGQASSGPSGWVRVLGLAAGLAVVGSSIVLSTRTAAAEDLERFDSCGALRDHVEGGADRPGGDGRWEAATEESAAFDTAAGAANGAPDTTGQAVAGRADNDSAAVPDAPRTAADDSAAGGGADGRGAEGTNTQVEGVDELDTVDVLADGRILVARDDRVVLVDATGEALLATLPVPFGPQLSFDDARSTLWVVSGDGLATTLTRAVVSGDAFADVATWSLQGRLAGLRRDGARVHLIAVDDGTPIIEPMPMPMPVEPDGGPGTSGGGEGVAGDASLPFAGTSPVPCDQVLHSPLPGGVATTLVVSFTAAGPLEPAAATEIVGAGDNVLVTASSLYVSTPTYDGDQPVTGIHRFDIADLTHTGSGSVPGRLLNQFSLDEHDGHLRAAVTTQDAALGRPVPVDGDRAVADIGVAVDQVAPTVAPEPPVVDGGSSSAAMGTTAGGGEDGGGSSSAAVGSAAGGEVDGAAPTPTDTAAPGPDRPASTAVETTPSAPTTTLANEPVPVEEPMPVDVAPTPPPPEGEALNEIVVFDTEGKLDVVGRSARFGHPGETLHGIRFAGDVAYAVTFLQTDPFYVIDMSRPTAPAVLGELEIPGFSAYLHPVSPTRVVGFGPGPDGTATARLFDTSDPTRPRLVDTASIADDSPVIYDHHALRAHGDELVVAANDWVEQPPARCTDDGSDRTALERRIDTLYQEMERYHSADPEGRDLAPEVVAAQREIQRISECLYPQVSSQARIVTLRPTGDGLGVSTVEADAEDAQRVLPLADGYLVVGTGITKVGPTGEAVADLV